MPNKAHGSTRTISCGDGCVLSAEIAVPKGADGIVVFVDGLSSGIVCAEEGDFRQSFHDRRLATIVVSPLVPPISFDPDSVSTERRRSVIDSGVACLIDLSHWLAQDAQTEGLGIGYFASDGGVAVALIAAADLGQAVQAVASVSGRPDFAGNALEWVQAPTLLIVAERDTNLVAFNEVAFDLLEGEKDLEILHGARAHGDSMAVLTEVLDLVGDWFHDHLVRVA